MKVAPTALLLALIGAIFFAGDGSAATVVLTTIALAFVGVTLLGADRPTLTIRQTWPYLAYLAALSLSFLVARTGPAFDEYLRQLLFLLVVFGVAGVTRELARQRVTVATMTLCAMVVLGQAMLFAWQSEQPDRLVRYPVVPQWSGYPELGLLAAVFASGALAIALFDETSSLRASAAYLALFFTTGSVFLYSRSAWITIAVTAAWLVVVALASRRPRQVRPAVAVVVVVVVSIGAAAWFVTPGAGRDRLAGLFRAPEAADRILGWRTGLAMLRDAPLVGLGPGMYHERYDAYQTADSLSSSRAPGELERDRSHAYNMLLHVGAELGLLGLVTYLAMWGRVLWSGLVSRRASGSIALVSHAMLVAFFIRQQSEHFLANLETSHRLLLLLAVLFGLAEALRIARPSDPFSSPFRPAMEELLPQTAKTEQ